MSDLLFTFSSKQMSPTVIKSSEYHPRAAVIDWETKPQLSIKNIRTKKIKRYQKVFESEGLKKQLTEVQNEFIGLENIASQTLVKLSSCNPLGPIHSIQTIEASSRPTRSEEIIQSKGFKSAQKNDLIRKTFHMSPPQQKLLEKEQKEVQQMSRKRGLSLKQGPLVSYPSDQRKLPRVFRSRSINPDSVQSSKKPKQFEQIKVDLHKGRTPKTIKIYNKKNYFQFVRPLRSDKHLSDFDEKDTSRKSQHLNAEEYQVPATPAFCHL